MIKHKIALLIFYAIYSGVIDCTTKRINEINPDFYNIDEYKLNFSEKCNYKLAHFKSFTVFDECANIYPLYYGKKLISLKECSLGKYCNFYEDIDKSVISKCKERINILPGNYCSSNSQCLSNKCENKKCKGDDINANCSSHADCNIGLFCSNEGKCSQLLNTESCQSDYECLNNKGCFKGKCIDYFSLNVLDESNNRLLCKTGTLINGYCNEINISEYKSGYSKIGKQCNTNSDCKFIYQDLSGIKYGESICSCVNFRNSDGICYESINKEFYSIYHKVINLNKHTLERFDLHQLTSSEIEKIKFPLYSNIPNPKDVDDILYFEGLVSFDIKLTYSSIVFFIYFLIILV